jgi:hypothetical protein
LIFGEAETAVRASLARGLAFTTKRKLEGSQKFALLGPFAFSTRRFSVQLKTSNQMDGMDGILFPVKVPTNRFPVWFVHFNGSIGRPSPPSCKRTQFR